MRTISGGHRAGDYFFEQSPQGFRVWFIPRGKTEGVGLGSIRPCASGWLGSLDPALGVGDAQVGPYVGDRDVAEAMHERWLRLRWVRFERDGAAS